MNGPRRSSRSSRWVAGILAATAAATVGAAVSHGTPTRPAPGLRVVAAENVWGSLATQLGGPGAHVTSIVTSPAADPHDYEPTAADARAFAGANLVIVNGAGYDPWAEKLLAANPVAGRIVLDVGDLVGVSRGGNPHRWYSPADVHRVIARIERDYATLDPRNTDRYASRRAAFESRGLADYHRLLTSIRRRYDGVRVGASESIFSPLARSVGLALATPPSFLNAISEGAEPTAKDIAAIERQIAEHAIAVWVENSQNTTPDVQRLTDDARAHGIPVTTITETLAPRATTFQQWQSGQLRALAAALAAGRER